MKFQTITLILMTIMLVSCGEKKASSVVNLKLIKGAIATNGTSLNGGILLMGRSEDGKNSFRTGVVGTDNVELDLPKGRWEFAAIAWQGINGVMTGDNRCSYSGFVDLRDDQATVNFNLTMANCINTFNGNDFADSDYINASGKFFDFTPTICLDQTPYSAKCNNSVNASTLHTYRIVYKADKKGDVGGRIDPLASQCFYVNDAKKTSIPVTDNANDNPLKPTISFYKNAYCDGVPALAYNFDQSVLETVLPDWRSIVPSGSNAMFYVNPGPLFDSEQFTASNVIFGGEYYAGMYYFDSAMIRFTIPALSPSVEMFCATVQASCNDNDWLPVIRLGTPVYIQGLGGDGSYQIRVFLKTIAGIVGGEKLAQFNMDTIAPSSAIVPTLVQSGSSLIVNWVNGDTSAFKQWIVQLCTDPACANVIANKNDFNHLSRSHEIISNDNGEPIQSGQYYGRIKTIDIFNRFSYSPISYALIFNSAP